MNGTFGIFIGQRLVNIGLSCGGHFLRDFWFFLVVCEVNSDRKSSWIILIFRIGFSIFAIVGTGNKIRYGSWWTSADGMDF